jgi:DNA (cytosine-5)-methyltransferase 1
VTAYYNEIDPRGAASLRELIRAGIIAPGDVDERSIEDVRPSDLAGYVQCHFFAGTGAWSYALRCAGWPDDRPVWTGSCPCQPFSAAGKGTGVADERHLWPAWDWLIGQCRPCVVFGEQVESSILHGWLDLVQSDMEGKGYAFGPIGLPAAGFGAPHIRQRLYFVADASDSNGRPGERREEAGPREDGERRRRPTSGGAAGLMADTETGRRGEFRNAAQPGRGGHADGDGLLVHALQPVLEGHAGDERDRGQSGREQANEARSASEAGAVNGFWGGADWIPFRDGKMRPVEPGTFPLAHGASARVGRLHLYGNSIVAPVAEAFVRAYMDLLA